jgi:DNA mismatch endonuclease, patch repair protein
MSLQPPKPVAPAIESNPQRPDRNMPSKDSISSWATSAATRRSMQGNRSTDTSPEVAARAAIHRAGLRFRKNVRFVNGIRCEADIVFPKQRLVVFIDGCFWHACPNHLRMPKTTGPNGGYWLGKISGNVARDRKNDTLLTEAGWLVLRFWEHDDPLAVADVVKAAVRLLNVRTEQRQSNRVRRADD